MKKAHTILTAAAIISSALAICAGAAFVKEKTYTAGMFTDVPADAWYAESVGEAYAYGFMQGESAAVFAPDGTLTVAEGVTVASRIFEDVSGEAIGEADGGAWYARYTAYASEKGLITDGMFDDYERPIKRWEAATLLARASGELAEINDVSAIPDVDSAAAYAPDVLKLYRAGILIGNDDDGNFAPESDISRAELAAVCVRFADAEKRIRKTFMSKTHHTKPAFSQEKRTFSDGYALIENETGIGRTNRSIANGWDYDNRFEIGNTSGWGKKYVADLNDTAFTALKREFREERDGFFTLEMMTELWSKDGGLYIAFEDKDENRLFGLAERGGKWLLFGKEELLTEADVPQTLKLVSFAVTVDLDHGTMTVVIDNRAVGSIAIEKNAPMQRLVLGTNEKGTGSVNISHVKLFKNYAVFDRFPAVSGNSGEVPVAYDVTGDFAIREMNTGEGYDIYSVKSETKAGETSEAVRRFTPTYGNVDVKLHLLLPTGADGASVSLLAADDAFLTIYTKDGAFYIGDRKLRRFTENVWQDIHMEANTETGEALIRIDGKIAGTAPFDASYIDGVKIAFSPDEDAEMWFDDLEIQCLVEHDDYVPEPVKPETDYTIGMYSCYLWRDALSGEGWDSVSSFPEFEPVLGYYDEGLRETADWEIKQMVEHGVDFLEYCWYAPTTNVNNPIKRSHITHAAFHDGFLNAKYRDKMRFCVMWEQSYQGAQSFEQFKKYIWSFWKEYYFADDNYLTVDNKIVITCWGGTGMFNRFAGGDADVCRQYLKELEDDVKDTLGYDGVIWLCANLFTDASSAKNTLAFGFAGYGGGGWLGTSSNNSSEQIRYYTIQEGIAEDTGVVYMPIISPGYNDVGRNDRRTAFISKNEHRKVCEYVKNMVDARKEDRPLADWIMIDSWNEYSEGHISAPAGDFGYDYLDNIRDVFTNAPTEHEDAYPTPEQKARIGHLYPPHHSPIRWFMTEGSDTGKTESEPSKTSGANLIPVVTWDMATKEGLDGWREGHGLADYKEGDGVIAATSKGDCSVTAEPGISADLAEVPVIHFRLRSDINDSFQIYFGTEDNPGLGESKKVTGNVSVGEHDYYVDMSTHPEWKGTLNQLRFDFLNTPGHFAVSLIEFMKPKYDENNPAPELIINGEPFALVFQPVETADGDYEIAAEATIRGFFSSMCLYHEWDRFDGILTVKTRDKRTFVFTVGSDKVTVDGEERPLGYVFRLRDGLPVFRFKKLCELLGYPYSVEGNRLSVTSATEEELALKAMAASGSWDYRVMTEVGDWRTRQCSVSVTGGLLSLMPSGTDSSISTTVNLAADDYTHALIGILYTEGADKWIANLFFGTDTKGLSADTCVAKKVIGPDDSYEPGDVIELTLDMTSNVNWKGTINTLRFDPHWELDPVYIQYIKLIKDEENASYAAKKEEQEQAALSDEFEDLPDVVLELDENDVVSGKYGLLLGEIGFENETEATVLNDRFVTTFKEAVYGQRAAEFVEGKQFGKSGDERILDIVPNGTAAHRISIGYTAAGVPLKGKYTLAVDVYAPQGSGNLSTFRLDFGGFDMGENKYAAVNAGKGRWITVDWSFEVLSVNGNRLLVKDGGRAKAIDASALNGANLWIVKTTDSATEHFYYDNIRLYYDPGTLSAVPTETVEEQASVIIYDGFSTVVTEEEDVMDEERGVLLGEVAFDYSYKMASNLIKASYPNATVYGSYVNGRYMGGFRIEMIGITENAVVDGAETETGADSFILDTVPAGTAAHRMQVTASSLLLKPGTYTVTLDVFRPALNADYSILRGDIVDMGPNRAAAVNAGKGKWTTVSWSFDVVGKDPETPDHVIIRAEGKEKSVQENSLGFSVWLQKVSPSSAQHYYYDNVCLYYKAA